MAIEVLSGFEGGFDPKEEGPSRASVPLRTRIVLSLSSPRFPLSPPAAPLTTEPTKRPDRDTPLMSNDTALPPVDVLPCDAIQSPTRQNHDPDRRRRRIRLYIYLSSNILFDRTRRIRMDGDALQCDRNDSAHRRPVTGRPVPRWDQAPHRYHRSRALVRLLQSARSLSPRRFVFE